MGTPGLLQFRHIAGKLTMLRVSCSQCGPAGRYRVDRLIERYGVDADIHEFVKTLPADCPNRGNTTDHFTACRPICPDLHQAVYGDRPLPRDESHTARLAWAKR